MKKSNIELANKLGAEDVCELINLFADRIDIYIGMSPLNVLRSAELDNECPCVMNGTTIQINTEWAFTDEVIPFVNEAHKDKKSQSIIERLQNEHNLNGKQIADLLNVTTGQVSKWKNGDSKLTQTRIEELQYLGFLKEADDE